jgi:hypothetical protein
MSSLAPQSVTCPGCQRVEQAVLFSSLNGDLLPDLAQSVMDGTFEARRCGQCGCTFQPEHPMLFVQHSAHLWIVMQPLADRPRFAAFEQEVERILSREFSAAAPALSPSLRAVRPRLVFGQHMLGEALRAARIGLDPGLLECAKLLALRRQLGRLLRAGPSELCFEQIAEDGTLQHVLRALPRGEVVGTFELERDALAEAQAARGQLEAVYPDLFRRPYASASRYLFGAMI